MILLSRYFQNLNLKQWCSYTNTDTTPLQLVAIFLIISTVTWYAWLFFFKPKTQSLPLPPGPPGLPIFGNLLSLDPELHTYFTGLARTHGPIFKLRLGSKLGIVVSSPSGERVKMEEAERIQSKDFLQFLLNSKEDGDSMTSFTITHVKALLMDMLVGGTNMSSNTIEFAMAEMMHKPEIMKRVQEELEAVVGKDNIVEESHIHKLYYLDAVMKETLRLHPMLPLLVPHCPSEDTAAGGYTIPKGSRVFVNAWAIQRDSSIWEKPLEFDPTRFLDTKWDYSGSDFSYLPFGSGRRICVGIAMAERTVLYLLATLVHLFDWTVPRGEMLDLSEKFGIVLKKETPLVAIPAPRLSNPDLYQFN